MGSKQSIDAEKQQSDFNMAMTRVKQRQKHTRNMFKRGLYGLAILFSIIGIATAVALLVKAKSATVQRYNEEYNGDYGGLETITGFLAIPIFAITAIWSIAKLVMQHFNKTIHPGAHVGVFLILWIAAIGSTIFCGGINTDTTTWDYDFEKCEDYSGNGSGVNYSHRRYCPSKSERATQSGLGIATVAFLCITGVVCFALFWSACIETSAYNRKRAASKGNKHSDVVGFAVPESQ